MHLYLCLILAAISASDSYVVRQAPSRLSFIRGLEKENSISCRATIENSFLYLKIDFFGRRTAHDFERELKHFKKERLRGIVLDLRNNEGGRLESAATLLGFFLPAGKIPFYTLGENGQKKEYRVPTVKQVPFPLAVIVNENTASSAELFAAALQRAGRAQIIGKKTRGKTTVQEPTPLNSRETLFVTVGKSHLADGSTVEGGVNPDQFANNFKEALKKSTTWLRRNQS